MKLGFILFPVCNPRLPVAFGHIFFFFSTVEELERPEKTETDFVNAVKLRKIQGREKDGPGDTFPSMNSACPESPGSEV